MLNRIYHYSYLIVLRVAKRYLQIFFSLKNDQFLGRGTNRASILALPAYPEGWPGGMERFANWKPYFEKEGIPFDISWPCSTVEYTNVVDRNLSCKKWLFHLQILFRRVRTMETISKYSTIYIQRELIPFYDSRYTGMDELIINNHPNVVYDFYDADYESTPKLTFFIYKHASKITVASRFLESLVKKDCADVFFTRICLPLPPESKKIVELSKNRIGWMGSPGNARNLIALDDCFSLLQKTYPQIEFSFVCRNPPDLRFKGIVWNDMNDPLFDYDNWLTTLDIGIVPYLEYTDRTKAKTAMKSLEFWANSVAMVCSPFGMSDKIESGVNCLIANDTSVWFDRLSMLIVDTDLRQEIIMNGFSTFSEFHTYERNYILLNEFLLN